MTEEIEERQRGDRWERNKNVLVVVDAGREEELALGDGVRVVVVEARGHGEPRRLAVELLAPEVVQGLAQPLLEAPAQLARLPARRAQHRVAAQLLLRPGTNGALVGSVNVERHFKRRATFRRRPSCR